MGTSPNWVVHCTGDRFSFLDIAVADCMGTSLARPLVEYPCRPGCRRCDPALGGYCEHSLRRFLDVLGKTVVDQDRGRCVCNAAYGIRSDAEKELTTRPHPRAHLTLGRVALFFCTHRLQRGLGRGYRGDHGQDYHEPNVSPMGDGSRSSRAMCSLDIVRVHVGIGE